MGKFDAKSFNEKAFKYGVENSRIPNLKTNELKKSKALKGSADIRSVFTSQNGTVYAEIAMKGLLDGDAVNYDGQTDITATSTKTFNRGVVVVGRAKAWTEKDFSDDVADEDFMDNVQDQVAEYLDNLDQNTILAILKGIFSMSTGAKNLEFVEKHTYDISGAAQAADQVVGQTTLNSAMNKACGANKKKFSMVFMHSDVATNLENLKLVRHLTYTDAEGIERPLDLAAWNGKIVIIDDEMPVEEVVSTAPVYSITISTAATAGDKITIDGTEYEFVANTADDTGNKIKVGASGTAAQQATNIAAKVTMEGFTITASSGKVVFTAASGTNPDAPEVEATKGDSGTIVITNATDTEAVVANKYTSYILGEGAIDYENIGAKKPYEMNRDPKTNGGEDTLYVRQRKVFAPYGISFTKAVMSTNSPTDAELKNGANWSIVHSGEASASQRSYINHKAIPIARIISKG